MNVVVLFDLVKGSVFVLEEAALAIGTEEPLGEGRADFGLVLSVIDRECFAH